MVDLVNGELGISVNCTCHRGIGDAGGYVDLVARHGDVERVGALRAAGLGAYGVAGGLELGGGKQGREDVELHELHLLLVGEGVEGPGFEVGEGAVSGGEEGHALLGAVELHVYLVCYFGVL